MSESTASGGPAPTMSPSAGFAPCLTGVVTAAATFPLPSKAGLSSAIISSTPPTSGRHCLRLRVTSLLDRPTQ